ncbi:phosphopantetheine-binding protein [Herbivorax sp. ANBcel31]|uniref:phosphopantetheine-binding protein n=1 Tax=Herbivorax sp. ANBcel31 TaxID=3069754 RepID=UPI0027AEBA9C|nr:phosphopantetheine-binding protein [Herbivorax sp. ANBcel31]MDQ2085431.1 phosphopantetheine-binding protein [Herbivorax sp. ANBcel31]
MCIKKNEVLKSAEERREYSNRVKTMIVRQLCLDIDPEFITNDQPLFGRGLELDSIDALELTVGIFDEFEVALKEEETGIFFSVNTIVDYLISNINENEEEENDN